jgi:hypothetical protein
MRSMITTTELDKKIDNIQDQLNIMNREATSFRVYVNRQFEFIFETMASKDDLYELEYRLRREMATKDDLKALESRLMKAVLKIAEKVEVIEGLVSR